MENLNNKETNPNHYESGVKYAGYTLIGIVGLIVILSLITGCGVSKGSDFIFSSFKKIESTLLPKLYKAGPHMLTGFLEPSRLEKLFIDIGYNLTMNRAQFIWQRPVLNVGCQPLVATSLSVTHNLRAAIVPSYADRL